MLFAQLSQLTHLHLASSSEYSEITGRDGQSLACLVNLKKLSWDSVRVPASAYMHLTGISGLTSLKCAVWQDEIMLLTQLHSLVLIACNQACFPGQAVSNLSRLSHLELTMTADAQFNINRLQKLPALHTLSLRLNCNFDQWMKLPGLSQVRSLQVYKVVLNVTEEVFGWLMTMKQLTSLTVQAGYFGHVSDQGLQSMKSMSCLEYMSFSCQWGLIPKSTIKTARAMVEDKHHPMKGYAFVDRDRRQFC